ncbi:MAG: hypothetical protein K2K81_07995 [Muribaculaceae bacterium]|nr:hypothetical protein [Muribaculaceae bacterium]
MKKRDAIFLATLMGMSSSMMAEIPEGFDTTTKWYTTFTNEANEFEWPAGSTYGSKVQTNEREGRKVIVANADMNEFTGCFITPLLKGNAGEEMTIDARINSTSQDGGIDIYLSATREGLSSEVTRTHIISYAYTSTDEETKLSDSIKQFSFTIPEEGQYYIGFSMYDRGMIAGIYGLELVEVPHDWTIAPGTMPATATQNQNATGSFKILNYGQQDEKAGTYTITTYVDGVATEQPGTVDIKSEHLLGDDVEGVEVPFTFRSPKVGTVTVKAVVTAEDGYSITSDPVEVEVVKETLAAEKIAGECGGSPSNATPFSAWDANTETIAIYTPELLGLKAGDKIKSIYLNGYVSGNVVGTESNVIVCYDWTDDTSVEKPVTGEAAYDYSSMNMLYNETIQWEEKGSASEMVPVLELSFDSPLVYEEGKSLILFFHITRASYKSGFYFESGSNAKTAWRQKADNNASVPSERFTGNWAAIEFPPIHVVLDVTPRSVSGNVNFNGEPVQDAVVTLISNDGENIQYEGLSDAEGNYSIDVIQSERVYDMEIHGNGFGEFDENLDFAEASLVKNIDLRREVRISDNGSHVGGAENAIVYFDKKLTPGYNMITLPLTLTADEVAEIFGAEAKVFDFDKDVESDGEVVVNFIDHEGNLEAGHPYLIYVESETKEMAWRSREASESLSSIMGTHIDIEATSAPTELTEGMVAMDSSLIKEEENAEPEEAKVQALSDEGTTLPAYSGYFALKPGKTAVSVMLNGTNIGTGIESIAVDEEKANAIYDLNGYKVANPSKGIYVINGKLILVK